MTTTVYQKFVSRYAETFTLLEMTEGTDFCNIEVLPCAKVSRLSEDELAELVNELLDSRNEKANWSDDEDEFDEEDARATYHQKWDEINSDLDKMGM